VLVSEFEAESISVGDPRFISDQLGDSDVPHQQDALDEMEVEAAREQEQNSGPSNRNILPTPLGSNSRKDLGKSSARTVALHPLSTV